jgi:hypothetical protein
MPIGKIFEIALEVQDAQPVLAGVKIFKYTHSEDDSEVKVSATRREDQFTGVLYTAKVSYPEGTVPAEATTLKDLTIVGKNVVNDIYGTIFVEKVLEPKNVTRRPRNPRPVEEVLEVTTPAPVVEEVLEAKVAEQQPVDLLVEEKPEVTTTVDAVAE